jgi:hypothetical protein
VISATRPPRRTRPVREPLHDGPSLAIRPSCVGGSCATAVDIDDGWTVNWNALISVIGSWVILASVLTIIAHAVLGAVVDGRRHQHSPRLTG